MNGAFTEVIKGEETTQFKKRAKGISRAHIKEDALMTKKCENMFMCNP